ncbi:MAG: prepilin-type N-terminal cleavage/methylation domain-containing protein [Terracidiphilus sp.]|jgi:type IV pilus assembly protein PilA
MMNCKNWISRRHRAVRSNGFTLMELLIVMAIVVILTLLAIPTVGSFRKSANKISAMKSIQAIQMAESMYLQNYPTNGYTCTLAALGGEPTAGAPTPTAAQLLKSDLASGYKDGYIFTIGNCTKVTAGGTDRITSYTISAVPQTVGRTGDIGFCADDAGIKSDPTGGTNCTQLVQ